MTLLELATRRLERAHAPRRAARKLAVEALAVNRLSTEREKVAEVQRLADRLRAVRGRR